MRRDLIVGYAEGHGGTIERYLREVCPRYWQKVDWRDRFDQIGQDLHLTTAEEVRILADTAGVAVPALPQQLPRQPNHPTPSRQRRTPLSHGYGQCGV